MNANTENRAPFIQHIIELRTRLIWCVLAILFGAVAGYFVHGLLLRVIQKPLGETLYYTNPTGALGFVIKICVVFGVLVGLPIIMFNLFAFLGPLLSRRTKKQTVLFTFLSFFLAVAGTLFAYFLTLPAALKFLVGFGNESIQSLITANEYFNFAFAYIVGFALLFQIPLILLFINRIKPLPPSKLFGALRYVVLGSFVISAIITPTPDPLNQAFMALPAISLYLVSAIILSVANRTKRSKKRVQRAIMHLPEAVLPELTLVSYEHPSRVFANRVVPNKGVISDFI